MAEIRLEKIKKSFKDISVIKQIDLTINDGEFFTFVGPSGCGKSTILNMIAGLEPITEGKIVFDNIVMNDRSPKDRDIALVFQSYALYPHMTVYENIAFPLRMKKTKEIIIDQEVKRIASLVDLEDLLVRKPKELSGGQRQRVALGRAIIRKPKVFLMDEPLSNLDARLRIEMRAELKKLHQDLKITTIYVTHDQAEAMSLSERIAVLHQGEIQQCGTPMELYSNPANIFVGGFIGSHPMNFIPAVLIKSEPSLPLSNQLKDKSLEGRLVVGIRPEDLIVSDEKDDDSSIEVKVSLIEPAGSHNWVDAVWNGIKIKGMSKTDTILKVENIAFIKIPKDKVFLFDEVSGKRI